VDVQAYGIERADQPGDTLGLRGVSLIRGRSHEVLLSAEDQIGETAYRVAVRGILDGAGNALRPQGGQARFAGAGWADTTGPRLSTIWPPDSTVRVALETAPALFFDEPVDTGSLAGVFTLTDTGGVAVEGSFRFVHGAAAEFVPHRPLDSDRWYVLRLDGSLVRDLSGNAMADTAVTVRFGTLDEERLGSLSGAVRRGGYAPQAVAVVMISGPSGEPRHGRRSVPGDEYLLDRLLPGAYAMAAFLDLTGDGLWNPGRAVPFRPAEPLWAADDSVTVRSRWETAGIDVIFEP
jgi:hypothetical protein